MGLTTPGLFLTTGTASTMWSMKCHLRALFRARRRKCFCPGQDPVLNGTGALAAGQKAGAPCAFSSVPHKGKPLMEELTHTAFNSLPKAEPAHVPTQPPILHPPPPPIWNFDGNRELVLTSQPPRRFSVICIFLFSFPWLVTESP